MFRIGFGNDIHRLVPGKRLILGGVEIESDLGADGHSDADALTHAVTDAILGALALGDIGTHFPNSDERWKNADSRTFLKKAIESMKWHGYSVVNVDSTVSLESPKLRPYIDEIRVHVAKILEVDQSCISVKAKTGEGVDAVGERKAVRAEAIVLLRRA
ncbi:MAG: 2-C-methyl-D-erythritol 2,4-cyclodiphosphate synthase [Pyrinomonadaceae bacterium]